MADTAGKKQPSKRDTAIGCVSLVGVVFIAAYFIHEWSSNRPKSASDSGAASSPTPAQSASPAAVSLSKAEMTNAPVITTFANINDKIKFLKEHPPEISDGTPRVMYWGHISSAIELPPTRIKAFDYKSDGSIEGIEMIWQVQGSEDEKANTMNTLIGKVLICQLIMLVGDYDSKDDTLLSVGKDLDQFVVQHGQEAVTNEVTQQFGKAIVRYKVIQDNGKNTPRFRIGLCPDF